MSENTLLDPARADSASGPAAHVIGLGKAVALRLAAYSVLLAFLAAGVFSALSGGARSGRTSNDWVQPVLYVAAYLCAVVAHELVHGLFFRLFGGRPRYGAGFKYLLPYFYATSPGHAFPLRQMILIALAPLLILSTLALLIALLAPALAGYLAVVFIGNTSGAVGDIWMASRLIKFLPFKDAAAVDLVDGMAIYSRDAEAGEVAARLSARDQRPAGFIVHWLGATLVVLAVEVLAGFIGPFLTDSLLIGPEQLPLMAYTRSSQGIAWTFNLTSPLLAGLVFALAARLFSRHNPRGAGSLPVP